jgi:tRNA G10  N-methylase Trm11
MINDPTASPWELGVEEVGGRTLMELRPRRLVDPRFAYRQQFVPAASHPTFAAALARLAGVRADDVVWDPFCGSGAELIERMKLGPAARILGTDMSADALAAARANVDAAGAPSTLPGGVELLHSDCLLVKGVKPTLIITNPPMGRRVQRGGLVPLLDRFVEHAAAELAPGGRLVWISPLPRRTAEALTKLGLRLGARHEVDMGGFGAEIQVAWR